MRTTWLAVMALGGIITGAACTPSAGAVDAGDAPGPAPSDAATPSDSGACPVFPSLALGVPVTDSTALAAADFTGDAAAFSITCGDGQGTTFGADLIFTYTPAADGKFVVRVTPASDYDVAVWVSTGCGGDPARCVGAADYAEAGGLEVVAVDGRAGVAYSIVVTSYDAQQSGAFAIEVDPLTAPSNDRCPGMDLTARSGEMVAGSTVGAADDYGGGPLSTTCNPGGYLSAAGNDVVYSYTPAADGVFQVTVTPVEAGFDPSVWVTESTCGGPGDACQAFSDNPGGGPESVLVHGHAATTYYLIVDSYAAGLVGDFSIMVRPLPTPDNATCPGTELSLGNPVAGTTLGSTNLQGAGPFSAACNGASPMMGEDVVYRYTPVASGPFTVAVTATTSTWTPHVWMTTGTCGGDGSACVGFAGDGLATTASLVADGVGGTTYYFIVDSGRPDYGGDFSIVVSSSPANDRCPGTALSALGVAVPGTTIGAGSDYAVAAFPPTCDPAPGFVEMSGPDVVYSYTPTSDGPFTVTVTPENGFDVAVWAREGTCGGDGTGCLAYADAGAGGSPETITIAGVADATYYFIVGPIPYSQDVGSFTLQVE